MKKDILGILGGMGPYAALEFNRKILDYDNASKDWEYIHTILDNDITIPSRTRHILYQEEDPTLFIIQAINNLAKLGVKAVVLPCNSVHYFYERVISHTLVPWLNMLEIVSSYIKEQGFRKTLVLGGYVTVHKRTYDKYLEKSYYLDDYGNEIVYALIEAVKVNNASLVDELADRLIDCFEVYRVSNGIDSILFGCTELAISNKLQSYDKIRTFDSNEIDQFS